MNHGCDGTYNVVDLSHDSNLDLVTEANATLSDLQYYGSFDSIFDIFEARHKVDATSVARVDIKAGEEILADYLFYVTGEDAWLKETALLRRVCIGEAVGDITLAETEKLE